MLRCVISTCPYRTGLHIQGGIPGKCHHVHVFQVGMCYCGAFRAAFRLQGHFQADIIREPAALLQVVQDCRVLSWSCASAWSHIRHTQNLLETILAASVMVDVGRRCAVSVLEDTLRYCDIALPEGFKSIHSHYPRADGCGLHHTACYCFAFWCRVHQGDKRQSTLTKAAQSQISTDLICQAYNGIKLAAGKPVSAVYQHGSPTACC